MSFTDQKPRKATMNDLNAKWGGVKGGKRFRCYLCVYKFKLDDIWRWIYAVKYSNFITCEKCDSEDVIERWVERNKELREKFWWFYEEYINACNYQY